MKNKHLSFAVIGHPIAHSRSPMIHEAFARACNISLAYTRIDADPDAFESIVESFFSENGHGLNVTIPFKERAFALAGPNVSQRAHEAAAVNTLWSVDGVIHGCNTDGVGLIQDLKRLDMIEQGDRILLLGAGGAARGVMGPLLESGCEALCIANRTVQTAQNLVNNWIDTHPQLESQLQACSLTDPALARPWDLIVNATSTSLSGQTITLPAGSICNDSDVYDMMYAAQPTEFLTMAKAQGARQIADGLGMLVCQASESFRIWHGIEPMTQEVITQVRHQLSLDVR